MCTCGWNEKKLVAMRLVDPVTEPAYGKVRARMDGEDDGSRLFINSEGTQAAQLHLAEFFALCRKHVTEQFGNHTTVEMIEAALKEAYDECVNISNLHVYNIKFSQLWRSI